ncbi:MAG: hypothetical protein EU532_12915 [Promethearchaeota archaeon]|nr:MAG: hypothetical protein EU532_12915 [Candidatus Lokiarchaeota archaeon]
MAEDLLNKKIKELESELKKKNKEISNYLDRIEYLEDKIMEIEDNLSNNSNKNLDPLLKFKLEELNRKNREMKDNMGYLRLENVRFKREIEKLRKDTSKSSSIRIIAQDPLSNTEKISLTKDLIYIENEIKKPNMNREEVGKKLRNLMRYIRSR